MNRSKFAMRPAHITRARSLSTEPTVPFRRTPAGLLSLKALSAYNDYLEARESGQSVASSAIECLSPNKLNAAQSAFCHRLGLPDIPEKMDIFLPAFYPSGYLVQEAGHAAEHHDSGQKALALLSREMVSTRFPRMPGHLVNKLTGLFMSDESMVSFAKQHGLEDDVIVNALGLREPLPETLQELAKRVKYLLFPRERQRIKHAPGSAYKEQVWAMKSVLGIILENWGARELQRFLDARLFAATIQNLPDFVCSQDHSAFLELAGRIGKQPIFRLERESGRLSTFSMYIVGAYDGDAKLGEGYGQSLILAQRRACLDAIRKAYLGDEHEGDCGNASSWKGRRPSDRMSDAALSSVFKTPRAVY